MADEDEVLERPRVVPVPVDGAGQRVPIRLPNYEEIKERAKQQAVFLPGYEPDIAVIEVRGQYFWDWESVWVQHRWAESSALFRFTAAERDPIPELWTKLQFGPGDIVNIYLGGILAVNNGIITDRQVAYDANSHGVQLMGRSLTYLPAMSSVDDKTNNFDGMTFEQVARKVLAPYDVGIRIVGRLNPRIYKKLQAEKGETIWDFLERIARPRGIVMGSDHLNNFLLIGDHTSQVDDAEVLEGENILRCQCLMSIQNIFSKYEAPSQTPADNQKHGSAASSMQASVDGTAPRYAYKLAPAAIPVYEDDELKEIAKNEAIWHEGTKVTATITVQGWRRPSSDFIWRAGAPVKVNSPMAPLNHVLKIQTVTFTQDSSAGTQTTLDLVIPWLLRDHAYEAPDLVAPGNATAAPPGPVQPAPPANGNNETNTPVEE